MYKMYMVSVREFAPVIAKDQGGPWFTPDIPI